MSDETLRERLAKALHDKWQNGHRSWEEACENLPGNADWFRRLADVALKISPSPQDVREECARVVEGFNSSRHTAHDMKAGRFPSKSDLQTAIAESIRALNGAPPAVTVGECLDALKPFERAVILSKSPNSTEITLVVAARHLEDVRALLTRAASTGETG